MNLEYRRTTEPECIQAARTRHRAALDQLVFLGFEELGVYGERVARHGIWMGLGGILGSVSLLMAEVARVDRSLTVEGFYPLLYSRKDGAYAGVSALGVSFYSIFLDGACAISSAYKGIEIWDKQDKLYKVAALRSIPQAWADHQKMVAAFREQGSTLREDWGMEPYFALLRRLADHIIAQPAALSIPAMIMDTLVFFGLLVAMVLLICLPGNILAKLKPSCSFVENLGIISLSVNILGILLGVAVPWLISRVRTGLGTVNGIGTRLIGAEPDPAGGGYVATKWLVIGSLPILPVRSYRVLGEFRVGGQTHSYKLSPLDRMDWKQVRDTARKSVVGYLLALGVFILIAVGMVLACTGG
jgi:hypothetical protein